MATEAIIKKWGNSLGIILPKETVLRKHFKENDKVLIEVVKEADLTDIYGTLPRIMSGQKFKDMVREGWGK